MFTVVSVVSEDFQSKYMAVIKPLNCDTPSTTTKDVYKRHAGASYSLHLCIENHGLLTVEGTMHHNLMIHAIHDS